MARFVSVGKYVINLDCIAKVETFVGCDGVAEAHVYLTNAEYVLLKDGEAEALLNFLGHPKPAIDGPCREAAAPGFAEEGFPCEMR